MSGLREMSASIPKDQPPGVLSGDYVALDVEEFQKAYATLLNVDAGLMSDDSKRAFCQGDVVLTPRPYLVRNRHIVDASSVLIATPKGDEELRSGTWSTVRYARKIRRDFTIKIIAP
jgi:hypothetical protein